MRRSAHRSGQNTGNVAIPRTEDEFKLVERLTEEAVFAGSRTSRRSNSLCLRTDRKTNPGRGQDLTQIKYRWYRRCADQTAASRGDHAKVPKDNETGMKLYPPESVKILVDNDYIMASLGVLPRPTGRAPSACWPESAHGTERKRARCQQSRFY